MHIKLARLYSLNMHKFVHTETQPAAIVRLLRNHFSSVLDVVCLDIVATVLVCHWF